jgi:shikimate dehydrogenase
VVGYPVDQSLSPPMHNYWIAKHGIDSEYVALSVPPEDFVETISALPDQGFVGVNVTVPHKLAAYELCSACDADARAAGAVNLLIFENGKMTGRNTDAMGFSAALEEALGPGAAQAGPVVILGAGGAARAVIVGLMKSGAEEIRIVNRTRDRAVLLANSIERAKVDVFDWGDWQNAFRDAGLLVNTTSAGMKGKEPLDILLDELPRAAGVADIVYNPIETALLREAKMRGQRTMDGLGMLMHQAVPSFAAWFGITPKVTPELRALLEEKLRV